MATATERSRLRRDTGTDATSLPDATADDIFTEAGEKYTDAGAIAAYSRVLVIQSLLSSSARLATYKMNESSENLSDVFKHLKELLKVWEDKTDDAITAAAGSSGAARFGGLRRKPATIREYPGWPS
jgi:gas vesicle protein